MRWLTRPRFFQNKPRRLNGLLFLLTVLFVLLTGVVHAANFFSADLPGDVPLPRLALKHPRLLLLGLGYTAALMSILLCHEMGHYLACRRHGIRASLPYFIPAPAFTLSGTFGAFIRIESPITSKRSLFDIGVAGPIAGFVAALPVVAVGLLLSRSVPVADGRQMLALGDPPLMRLLAGLVPGPSLPGREIVLHPIAFAGWFGLLATAFNLFPIGQLDGGHIIHALFGGRAQRLWPLVVAALVLLGIFFWPGWLVWALLVLLIGRRHPPVQEAEKLDHRRRLLALAVLAIFILSFTPAPISLPSAPGR